MLVAQLIALIFLFKKLFQFFGPRIVIEYFDNFCLFCGAVAERLLHCSCDQKVPSLIGHQCGGDLSMLISIGYMSLMLCAPLDW